MFLGGSILRLVSLAQDHRSAMKREKTASGGRLSETRCPRLNSGWSKSGWKEWIIWPSVPLLPDARSSKQLGDKTDSPTPRLRSGEQNPAYDGGNKKELLALFCNYQLSIFNVEGNFTQIFRRDRSDLIYRAIPLSIFFWRGIRVGGRTWRRQRCRRFFDMARTIRRIPLFLRGPRQGRC